jgi:hypothetical protein
MDDLARHLLVTLHEEPRLNRLGTTYNAAFLSVQHVNGVLDVVRLDAISPQTLCSFLLSDAELRDALKREQLTPYNAIRRYWKRPRQPGLPLDWAT